MGIDWVNDRVWHACNDVFEGLNFIKWQSPWSTLPPTNLLQFWLFLDYNYSKNKLFSLIFQVAISLWQLHPTTIFVCRRCYLSIYFMNLVNAMCFTGSSTILEISLKWYFNWTFSIVNQHLCRLVFDRGVKQSTCRLRRRLIEMFSAAWTVFNHLFLNWYQLRIIFYPNMDHEKV